MEWQRWGLTHLNFSDLHLLLRLRRLHGHLSRLHLQVSCGRGHRRSHGRVGVDARNSLNLVGEQVEGGPISSNVTPTNFE